MKQCVRLAVQGLAGGAKTVAVVVALVGTVTLVAAPAMAASAHFVGKVTATFDSDHNLQVCWKEVGLGGSQTLTYEASATASATYRCLNPTGVCPGAVPPIPVTGPVTKEGVFSAGQNGQITQCLTIEAPVPPLDACSGPLTPALADITYSNIAIEDRTNAVGPVDATPVSLSAVIFECNP